MKFGPLPTSQALGKILGHNVAGPDGRRLLRKGKALTVEDVAKLDQIGRQTVYVAELEPGDVGENMAAARIASAITGQNLRRSRPLTGRVNIFSLANGLLRIDFDRLVRLNAREGVTVATLEDNSVVSHSKVVATVKILPYALPESLVHSAELIPQKDRPIIGLEPFVPRKVGLILSGSPSARERIIRSFKTSLDQRLTALEATIAIVDYVSLEDADDEDRLAGTIRMHVRSGMELIILAGETAIMDRLDIAPRAVGKAGGNVTCYGAPVDPGNLLMLAYHGSVPVMGAPGCARSPKANIVDLLLPRLLVGDHLTAEDIVRLGHGGLLEDISDRPMPRNRIT